MISIGIDPGLNGAICIIDFSPVLVSINKINLIPMPLNGREVDCHALAEIFQAFHMDESVMACLEKVSAMPKQGVSSMFKFGRCVGALQAILASFKIPYSEVTPQAWQKEMHVGINRKCLPRPKERSLSAAKKLFPRIDLLKSRLSKVPHEGFVDALLIAEYGRRRMGFVKS